MLWLAFFLRAARCLHLCLVHSALSLSMAPSAAPSGPRTLAPPTFLLLTFASSRSPRHMASLPLGASFPLRLPAPCRTVLWAIGLFSLVGAGTKAVGWGRHYKGRGLGRRRLRAAKGRRGAVAREWRTTTIALVRYMHVPRELTDPFERYQSLCVRHRNHGRHAKWSRLMIPLPELVTLVLVHEAPTATQGESRWSAVRGCCASTTETDGAALVILSARGCPPRYTLPCSLVLLFLLRSSSLLPFLSLLSRLRQTN